MKLGSAIKEKGNPYIIPDCSRNDLPQFFVDMGYQTGVEIGVYKAKYTEKLCESGLKIYAVDPWGIFTEYPRDDDTVFINRQQFLYEHALRVLNPFNNCTVIRKTSMEVVKEFDVGSIDFVYIDGDHRFRYIAEDIYEWSKIVRTGGIVSGHDYFDSRRKNADVKCIVDAYTKEWKINPWYVLGRKDIRKIEETRDSFRSWMWIKN